MLQMKMTNAAQAQHIWAENLFGNNMQTKDVFTKNIWYPLT